MRVCVRACVRALVCVRVRVVWSAWIGGGGGCDPEGVLGARDVELARVEPGDRCKVRVRQDAVRRLGTADDRMCTICVENPKNAMCLPCRHVFACMACSEKIETCSICRAHIASIDRVFIC